MSRAAWLAFGSSVVVGGLTAACSSAQPGTSTSSTSSSATPGPAGSAAPHLATVFPCVPSSAEGAGSTGDTCVAGLEYCAISTNDCGGAPYGSCTPASPDCLASCDAWRACQADAGYGSSSDPAGDCSESNGVGLVITYPSSGCQGCYGCPPARLERLERVELSA